MKNFSTACARGVRVCLLAVLTVGVVPLAWSGNAATALPSDSVYQLTAPLTDQAGRDRKSVV